jgi:hypothetical protein
MMVRVGLRAQHQTPNSLLDRGSLLVPWLCLVATKVQVEESRKTLQLASDAASAVSSCR